MTERRVTEAARVLQAFLAERELSIGAFCRAHSLERIQVQRFLKGERWQQIPVDFADDLIKATRGRLKLAMFRSDTARAPKQPRQAA